MLIDLRTSAYRNRSKINQYWFTGNPIAGEDIDYSNDNFGIDVSNVLRSVAGDVDLALKYGFEGTRDRVRTQETGPDARQTSSGWGCLRATATPASSAISSPFRAIAPAPSASISTM